MENIQLNKTESTNNFVFSVKEKFTDKFIETAPNVKLYVKDYGTGAPVILIHGWPLSNEMWEYQIENLVANNYRVITYDRRGFGKSSQPWNGYDYDTLTDDLKSIIDQMELTNITLVGFSMGGGEVVRYFSRYAGQNVSKAVLVSSIIPYLAKSDDNPDGRTKEKNEATQQAIMEDRIGFLDGFGKNFFGVGFINNVISSPLLEYYRMLASFASAHATTECAKSFSGADFRKEVLTIKVPTLIIHGNADKIVPIEISSEKTAQLIANNTFIIYDEAPHGLFYTDKDKLNSDLLEFLNS
ncbi:alpha/beta hydrolase [Flavobacterium sp.]|uniref:alpha/beta fold hydrolase n=1 Tax=Flavobacterium sp. TaxID=239 RepID=UPI00286EA159|nr:alpha/beta hydrolase [Flavobacterium sp.]